MSDTENDVRGGSYAALVETHATDALQAAGDEEVGDRFAVVIRLVDGDRIEADAFAVEGDAHRCAEGFVAELGGGRWPRVGQRYVRPEAVVSVDVARDEQPRWTGSTGRATSWTGRTGSE